MSRGRAFFRAVFALIWKDLLAELRSFEMISAMLVFALTVILVFNFALELTPRLRAELSSGVLWVSLAFSGTLGLNRSLGQEKDRGCWDGLLLAPVDRLAIFLGKVLANWLFLLVSLLILLPVLSILYDPRLWQPGIWGVALLGTFGYVVVGTLLASMAVQSRTRDVLLPILLFPVLLPVLVASVKASSGFLLHLPGNEVKPWLVVLWVYDLIFLALALFVFDTIIEE
jgi:heme exporter protein B